MTSSTLKNKVSPHIQDQLPGFIKSDHPLFASFLKHYYEFLESGELVVSGSNDYVIEETITENFILSEDGVKVVLESSIGKFTAGEIITVYNPGNPKRLQQYLLMTSMRIIDYS